VNTNTYLQDQRLSEDGSVTDVIIKDVLLDRIRTSASTLSGEQPDETAALSEQLAANTFRLFSAIVGLQSELPLVMSSLVFDVFPPIFQAREIREAKFSEFVVKFGRL